MDLKYGQLLPILDAIKVIQQNQLSLPTRSALLKVRRVVEEAHADYGELKDQLIFQYTDGGTTIDTEHPRWDEFLSQYAQLLEAPVRIEATAVCFADYVNREFGPEFDILHETGLITL